ncbi:hypothetical protein EYF80_041532 [Liparis tanakae]|uniref:Uncharacterized protein n=1 Tax=Liparis tanakae TaxID=230148 RepID=A0A4Z2G6U2_9TELE|nr:hypothetical protein EYF80_041532 [Liparis tanakae]
MSAIAAPGLPCCKATASCDAPLMTKRRMILSDSLRVHNNAAEAKHTGCGPAQPQLGFNSSTNQRASHFVSSDALVKALTDSTSLTLWLESGLQGGVTSRGLKGTVSPDSSPPAPTQLWRTVVPAANPDSRRARARDAIRRPPALFRLADAVAICRAPASSVRKARLWDGRL